MGTESSVNKGLAFLTANLFPTDWEKYTTKLLQYHMWMHELLISNSN